MQYIPPLIKTKELHIWDQKISKLYTDYCGRLPIIYRSGNKYIMIAYHCDSNTILQSTIFQQKIQAQDESLQLYYEAIIW